jgi:hypothetical protein
VSRRVHCQAGGAWKAPLPERKLVGVAIKILWVALGIVSLVGLWWTTPAEPEHQTWLLSQEFLKEVSAVGFEVVLAGGIMEGLLRLQDRRLRDREKRLELVRALEAVIDDLNRGKFLMGIHRSQRTWKEQVEVAAQSKMELNAIIEQIKDLKLTEVETELRSVTGELDKLWSEYKGKRPVVVPIQKQHEKLPDETKDSEDALDQNWTRILKELDELKKVWIEPSSECDILKRLQRQRDKLVHRFHKTGHLRGIHSDSIALYPGL